MPDVTGRGRTAVVFAGGGTGGHLYPALALADALREARPDVRPFFVGSERGIEARVLPERGVEHLLVPVRGFSRDRSLGAVRDNLGAAAALARSVTAVAGLFRRIHPELVVITGGYAAGPAGLVAALGGVPLAIQEQNSVPGMVNKVLSRVARQIHVAFPEAADHLPASARERVLDTGNPIRPPADVDRAAARRAFGLEPDGPLLLVMGGSQGSLALNRVVTEAVEGVRAGRLRRPPGLQVLWSTGPTHLDSVRDALGDVPPWVRVTGYVDDMSAALGAGDAAVSRAGAMATSEFLAWGIPSVLVPLPTAAADHQTKNAVALAEAGAGVHLPEAGLQGDALWAAVDGMLGHPDRLEERRLAARARGRPEAAARIADHLASLLPPPAGRAP